MIGLEKIKYNMQRHEIKFLLNEEQYARLLPLLSEHMEPDPYGPDDAGADTPPEPQGGAPQERS